jgi:hypothetical protein
MIEIEHAPAAEAIETTRALFQGFCADQGFAAELDGLPGDYRPPRGRLMIAPCGGVVAGCVAVDERRCTPSRVRRHCAYRHNPIAGVRFLGGEL